MSSFTDAALRERADEYVRLEPLVVVENERLETLPNAFADGSFLWKDAEWVVRWYARRALDGRVDPAEEAFRRNGMDELRGAIRDAVDATENDEIEVALESLTSLEGVDVPVASAYLHYIDPERYVVVDERLWEVLVENEALEEPIPSPVTAEAYECYLETCRELADRHGLELVALYRALWRLS